MITSCWYIKHGGAIYIQLLIASIDSPPRKMTASISEPAPGPFPVSISEGHARRCIAVRNFCRSPVICSNVFGQSMHRMFRHLRGAFAELIIQSASTDIIREHFGPSNAFPITKPVFLLFGGCSLWTTLRHYRWR